MTTGPTPKTTPRLSAVLEVLMIDNALTTTQVAAKVRDTDYWKDKRPEQVITGVASACYTLRAAGLIQSAKTPSGDGRRGEYEHKRFARRHQVQQPQAGLRTKRNSRTISETPINRVLAAAARIEQDAQKLGDALGDLQEQFNAFKELQEIAAKLSNGRR